MTTPPFPVDDVTLDLVEHALGASYTMVDGETMSVTGADMNLSQLLDFMAGYDPTKQVITQTYEDGSPMIVEYQGDPLYERDDVIRSLIDEVRRLRKEQPLSTTPDPVTTQGDPIMEQHFTDDEGRPAGGFFKARGIDIAWQNGPLRSGAPGTDPIEPNGAFVEDVIRAAIGRIEHYQQSEFHGIHNAVALGHLYAAAEVLAERTRDRQTRGVEGTHQK